MFCHVCRCDLESSDYILWVEIKIKSITLVCGACYRPPCIDFDANMGFLENLRICLDKLQLESNKVVTLLGDLNGNYNVENPSESGDFGSLLYHWMECNNLSQVINEPTRITSIGATLLDLIITNCPGYFGNSGTLSPPANCDTDLFPLK